jgi:hypothetical protein
MALTNDPGQIIGFFSLSSFCRSCCLRKAYVSDDESGWESSSSSENNDCIVGNKALYGAIEWDEATDEINGKTLEDVKLDQNSDSSFNPSSLTNVLVSKEKLMLKVGDTSSVDGWSDYRHKVDPHLHNGLFNSPPELSYHHSSKSSSLYSFDEADLSRTRKISKAASLEDKGLQKDKKKFKLFKGRPFKKHKKDKSVKSQFEVGCSASVPSSLDLRDLS